MRGMGYNVLFGKILKIFELKSRLILLLKGELKSTPYSFMGYK